ncbi:uncharacterized protein LOC114533514 [Dendronephthya gigantea]|nr:uncharacterized protein LOC114533514 [Dendronephthya gigantea]XP_028410846.1 uncharacterized protein LOC114533514 [Dendronephthya gigantea]XP_028410847.1 uncharacterized protein LOC114533514 [Dendronephthya gigantea]
MHASMEEIIDLVSYLRPLNVYPTVEPAGIHSLKDTQESLQQYTRCEVKMNKTIKNTPTSRDADEENPTSFKEQKSSVFSGASLLRYTPSVEVLAECRQLGLENENFMGLSRRRKRRNNQSPNGRASCEIKNVCTDSTEVPHEKCRIVDS